jgi:hypothetical protein
LEEKAAFEDASMGLDENRPLAAKRKASSAEGASARAKAARPADSMTEDFVVELDGPLRRATVKVFKGIVQVDLREFYEVSSLEQQNGGLNSRGGFS